MTKSNENIRSCDTVQHPCHNGQITVRSFDTHCCPGSLTNSRNLGHCDRTRSVRSAVGGCDAVARFVAAHLAAEHCEEPLTKQNLETFGQRFRRGRRPAPSGLVWSIAEVRTLRDKHECYGSIMTHSINRSRRSNWPVCECSLRRCRCGSPPAPDRCHRDSATCPVRPRRRGHPIGPSAAELVSPDSLIA